MEPKPVNDATYLGGGETLVNTVHGFPLLTRADSLRTRGRLLAKGEFQPEVHAVLSQTLRSWDVVVEIGAGAGELTVACGRRVGIMGRIFAFEPDRVLCRVLARNIELNRSFGLRAEVDIFGATQQDDSDGADADHDETGALGGFDVLRQALTHLAEVRLLRFGLHEHWFDDDWSWLAPLLDERRIRNVLMQIGDVTARPDWPGLRRFVTELVNDRGGSLGLIESDGSVRAISLDLALHVDRLDHLLVELPSA